MLHCSPVASAIRGFIPLKPRIFVLFWVFPADSDRVLLDHGDAVAFIEEIKK
jgi:hypothetical protein